MAGLERLCPLEDYQVGLGRLRQFQNALRWRAPAYLQFRVEQPNVPKQELLRPVNDVATGGIPETRNRCPIEDMQRDIALWRDRLLNGICGLSARFVSLLARTRIGRDLLGSATN